MKYIDAGAEFSEGGSETARYRYRLWRDWGSGILERRIAVFWLCNPSTADGEQDDPTIRRCVEFAKRWNCTGLEIGNIHAYRATDPGELLRAKNQGVDVEGPRNEENLARMVEAKPAVIVGGWGTIGRWVQESHTHIAGELYRRGTLHALALNKDGSPRHPLYQPSGGFMLPPTVEALRDIE